VQISIIIPVLNELDVIQHQLDAFNKLEGEREFFDRLGGFPSIELMEDIELARRAKRVFKPYILDDTVISSSRRWERNGPIKTVLFMWYLQGLFKIGVRPFKLAEMYRSGDWFNFKREKL